MNLLASLKNTSGGSKRFPPMKVNFLQVEEKGGAPLMADSSA